MSAERLPKMDDTAPDRLHYYSPELLRHTNWSAAPDGDMACAADSIGSDSCRRPCLQAVGKKTMEVTYMKRKKGRPSESGSVCATPIFRNPPDIQKLGRAVLKLAEHLAGREKKEDDDAA